MARQRYYHDPARKHIETYQDFSGGLNVMSSNDNVKDTELITLVNADLGERGSLTRRKGYDSETILGAEEGRPQMISRIHRQYAPYNLMGIDGSFNGQLDRTGDVDTIGAWSGASTTTRQDVFKLDPEEAGNLIINGEFENGKSGWTTSQFGQVIESPLAYGGSRHVMKLEKPKGDSYPYRNQYQSRWLDTQEGEQYFLEAMYRLAPDSAYIPEKILGIAWYELADGTRSTVTFAIGPDLIRGEWKALRGYLTMPKNTVKVCFGIGMYAYQTAHKAAVYIDNVFVRKESAGLRNGAGAIGMRARPGHSTRSRGFYISLNGLKPNTRYAYIVSYRSDGKGVGRLGIIDSRYRESTHGELFAHKDLFDKPTEWTTKVLKFTTHARMTEAWFYVYNLDEVGNESVVYYKDARVYEVKNVEEYNSLDTMTPEELEERFPFRVGSLRNETITDTVVAVDGTFYVNGNIMPVEGGYPIQNERIMEGAVYGDYMFIASGSGLLAFNGSTIAKVNPYLPTPLEELYIGSNALISNYFTVSDEVQDVVEIKDIKFSQRYGVTNKSITISVGVGRPFSTNIAYKYERRNVRDRADYWQTLADWSTNHQVDFTADTAGEYQFRISIRVVGKTEPLEQYVIPRYIIKPTEDEKDIPIDGNTIDRCNRILVHWDRLILYGDGDKQDVMYISDLQNPGYFPVNNTLWFENPLRERITSVVRFRDNLVVFTPSSVQALFGTNPDDFRRVMLNPGIGCIATRGAAVVKNYIIFPSYEGIALLKSIGMSEDRANIDIIDDNIKSLVSTETNAVAYTRNNQYCLVYPDRRMQLRFYYEWGVWVMDESPSLSFRDAFVESGKVFALGEGGKMLYDSESYADEGTNFKTVFGTKNFFFGEQYAVKKTREVQIMFDTPVDTTPLQVKIWADRRLLRDTVIDLVPEEDVYTLNMAGKGLFIRVELIHEDNKPVRLDGLGFIFKLKNP